MSSNTENYPDISSMIFAPHWETRSGNGGAGPIDDAILVAPASQGETLEKLKEVGLDAFALDDRNANEIAERIARDAARPVVFVSNSKWGKGVEQHDFINFLRLIKALGPNPVLSLSIVTVKAIASPAYVCATAPVDAVYLGLAQTLSKEFPEWRVSCYSLAELCLAQLGEAIDDHLRRQASANVRPICINADGFFEAELRPCALPEALNGRGFKKGGKYLILGGNGGIGGELAKYLAEQYKAQIVIVGRRPVAAELRDSINSLGGSLVYEQADLGDADRLKQALSKHSDTNGVIHSALVLEDSTLMNMTEESLTRVLVPKVTGTVNLINVIDDWALDFVLFFSSIQSYIANAGQANYTAACVCKDSLADLVDNALMIPAKIVNWGFWGSVGIVAKESYKKRMEKMGVGSIELSEGLSIIERFLHSDIKQISVVKASDDALRKMGISLAADLKATKPANRTTVIPGLVPEYQQDGADVIFNEECAAALEAYARARFKSVELPARIEKKFQRLSDALQGIPDVESLDRAQMLERYPQISGHVNLLDRCIENYPEVLSGRTDPLSVIFPNGSFELVEPVYRDNPIADYFNKVVAEIAANYIDANHGKTVRILEIGAGTGSTTQFVLPAIAGQDVEYTFTDLSLAFLRKARVLFSEYDFVKYEIYNVENQATFAESFDIVIATNVIHATRNLDVTVSNVKNALKANGIFILNEITSRQDFATLTFGLTDGWWFSSDSWRIPNSPLLSGESWRELMLNCGFSETQHHGSKDQQVIVGLLDSDETRSSSPTPNAVLEPKSDSVRDRAEAFVKQVISEVMQMAPEEIDSSAPFKEYGIDSLISMELIKPFNEALGYVPATILFEYPSVERLAEFLLSEHGDVFVRPAEEPSSHREETVGKLEGAACESRPDLTAVVEDFVRQVIADVMLIESRELKDDRPFSEYGIDSIITLELVQPLKDVFGYLPSTLLFEYPTIRQLARFLLSQNKEAANELAGMRAEQAPPETAQHSDQEQSAAGTRKHGDTPESGVGESGLRDDDIAIVGYSGRFPSAPSCDEFWELLVNGLEASSPIPGERWDSEKEFNKDSPAGGGSYTMSGAFIDDIDAFDHRFFNISPLDAERMDPQERLFLQTGYQALLSAGITQKSVSGSDTGVFVGVMNGGYAWHNPADTKTTRPTSLFWSIANRLSYCFNLRGPSIAIDTACSSSLTALHTAIQSVKAGDCETAIVGGVNLIVHPRQLELLCQMHMLSRTNQCKPFGKGADGFVDGEGVCALVIKRYAAARLNGDTIHAVIRGSAINSGGQSNGYSAPNPEAQISLIKKAISRSGIQSDTIDYIEAHGTGTELGDPIEVRALSQAFSSSKRGAIALGSVKGNVGHLESAAGLTGLIKILLQLRHEALAPTLHSREENPHLALDQTPFVLNKQTTKWPRGGRPRRAGLSSFGAGGSNAHVVIEEGPPRDRTEEVFGRQLICLSAKSIAGLQLQIDQLRNWVEKYRPNLPGLAYTLNCERDHFEYRKAYLARNLDDLLQLLRLDLQEQAPQCESNQFDVLLQRCIDEGFDDESVGEAVIAHYQSGGELPWDRLFPSKLQVELPGYAFTPFRHWVDSEESGFCLRSSVVDNHRIFGQRMAPATFSLSHIYQAKKCALSNVTWREVLTDVKNIKTQWDGDEFSIRSGNNVVCEGRAVEGEISPSRIERDVRDGQLFERAEIYSKFEDDEYIYKADYKSLNWAKVTGGVVKACVTSINNSNYTLNPALLDGGLQAAILMPELRERSAESNEVLVPCYLGSFVVMRVPRDEPVYVYCVLKQGDRLSKSVTVDLFFTDINRNVLIEMRDMVSMAVSKAALTPRAASAFEAYEIA